MGLDLSPPVAIVTQAIPSKCLPTVCATARSRQNCLPKPASSLSPESPLTSHVSSLPSSVPYLGVSAWSHLGGSVTLPLCWLE